MNSLLMLMLMGGGGGLFSGFGAPPAGETDQPGPWDNIQRFFGGLFGGGEGGMAGMLPLMLLSGGAGFGAGLLGGGMIKNLMVSSMMGIDPIKGMLFSSMTRPKRRGRRRARTIIVRSRRRR